MSSKGVSTKLYVGNLPDLCRKEELLSKFEKYGDVIEFDIVGNYGFAHYKSADEARAAADALNGTDYNGNSLKVELSHSRVRQKPGMGEKDGCFRCGQEGHWSKDCPRGPRRPRAPPGGYRDPYDDDPYYRDRDPYDPYLRARYLPPPPPGYARYDPYYDPYDRRPLPLPRDPYLRERLADPYPRPHPDYYARRSPPLSAASAAARDPYEKERFAARLADPYAKDPYGKDPYSRDPYSKDPYPATAAARDPYAKDPYSKDPYGRDPYSRDSYPATAAATRDPYEELYERRRTYAASMRSTPYTKPDATYAASMRSTPYTKPDVSTMSLNRSTMSSSGSMSYSTPMQSSRVPGPY